MKPEEKLYQLFEAIRNEKASTDISEVNNWLSKNNTAKVEKTKGNFLTLKTILVMSSIIFCIAALFYFFSADRLPKETSNYSVIQEKISKIPYDSVSDNTFQEKLPKNNSLPNEKNKPSDYKQKTEPNPEIISVDHKIIEENNNTEIYGEIFKEIIFPEEKVEWLFVKPNKRSGSWRAQNDSLKIDTLFSGIKKLVFKGDKCDISVRGSAGTDVNMKYNYQLKAKGIYSRKKETNCKLVYELKDSVLTINLQRKGIKFSGISSISETSKMEFTVPESIEVRLDSELGDINADGLKNNVTFIQTALGDITAKNMSGTVDLETSLGDISLKNISGKLEANTSQGDISGENISITADCYLNSSLGDVEVQLNNPVSELNLNLSTSLGKVKVNRSDLTIKSNGELKTGSGKFKLNMNTSLGNIIVR